MPRIKIEDVLPSGERISIVLEGRELSEKRVSQILELLRILSGGVEREGERTSLSEIIWDAILDNFGNGAWFTCRDLYRILNEEYGLSLKMNSVATYLLRFFKRGLLDRKGQGYGVRYRVIAPLVFKR